MKKEDLRTGMIIETRDGLRGLVVKDNIYGEDAIVKENDLWINFSSIRNDLTTYHEGSRDIMKVLKPKSPTGFLDLHFKKNSFEVLWQRHDVKELTIEQIFERLGYEIKIIKA